MLLKVYDMLCMAKGNQSWPTGSKVTWPTQMGTTPADQDFKETVLGLLLLTGLRSPTSAEFKAFNTR